MAVGTGVNFLVQVNTGTTASPTWTTVGNQRTATTNLNTETVDITSKGNANWADTISTFRSWSIDLEGLMDESDSGYNLILTAFKNKVDVGVRLLTQAGATMTGTAVSSDLKLNLPYDDAAGYSVTFNGKGALAFA